MTPTLPDVNVLVALAWPNHAHHRPAHAWFRAQRSGWATCAITELGFVRVSCSPALGALATTPGAASSLLTEMTALEGHHYWADEARFATASGIARAAIVGHRQVTDAYLVALAVHHGGRIATFDRSLVQLADRRHSDAVEVINAG